MLIRGRCPDAQGSRSDRELAHSLTHFEAAPAPIGIWGELAGAPARSLNSLSAAKRKLLAKRIRGER